MKTNHKNLSFWIVLLAGAIATVQLVCSSFGASLATNLLLEVAAVLLATLVGKNILKNDISQNSNEENNLKENIKSSILEKSQQIENFIAPQNSDCNSDVNKKDVDNVPDESLKTCSTKTNNKAKI